MRGAKHERGTVRTRVIEQDANERERENALNLDDNIIIFKWDDDT